MPTSDGPTNSVRKSRDFNERDDFELEMVDQTAIVTMRRPPVNALDDEFVFGFERVLSQIENEPAAAVVLIASGLPIFCAGADLKMIAEFFRCSDPGGALAGFSARLQNLFSRIENFSLPCLAAIGGTALGGGLELALSCDIRIASEDAHLGLPEVKIGLLPGAGGTQRLPLLVGAGVARRLILTGEAVTGEEAKDAGLVEFLVSPDDFDSEVVRIAGNFAIVSSAAVREARTCIGLAGSPKGASAEISASRRLAIEADTQVRVQEFLSQSGRRAQ